MTRDEAKQLLPIIQAFADGRVIEFNNTDGCGWHEINEADFIHDPECYRIKPGPVGYWAMVEGAEVVAWFREQEREQAERYASRHGLRIVRMVEG